MCPVLNLANFVILLAPTFTTWAAEPLWNARTIAKDGSWNNGFCYGTKWRRVKVAHDATVSERRWWQEQLRLSLHPQINVRLMIFDHRGHLPWDRLVVWDHLVHGRFGESQASVWRELLECQWRLSTWPHRVLETIYKKRRKVSGPMPTAASRGPFHDWHVLPLASFSKS